VNNFFESFPYLQQMNDQFKSIFGEDFVRNLMESMQSGQGGTGMGGIPGMFGMPGANQSENGAAHGEANNHFRAGAGQSGPAPGAPAWNPFGQGTSAAKFPSVAITETRHELVLVFDLPGLDRANDVRISVFPEQVTVKGDIPNKVVSGSELKQHMNERKFGAFERTIALPVRVKRQHAKAVYQQGLLELRLLKENRANDEGAVIDVDFA